MRLVRVEVSNFRSIESAEIEFEPRCRILIGKNEVGKSNLLKACGLLDPSADIRPGDLRETRDNEDPVTSGYVRFVFGLSADHLTILREALARRVFGGELLWSDGSREISVAEAIEEFKEWIYQVDIPSGRRRKIHWSIDEYQLHPGWYKPKPSAPNDLRVRISGKDTQIGEAILVHDSILTDSIRGFFEEVTAEEVERSLWEFINSEVDLALPECLYWTYADSNLLPATIDIETFRSDPKSCEPLRAMFVLAKEYDPGSAIDRSKVTPNGLKNLLGRVARAATAHVKSRWPELGNIEFALTPNGDSIDAAIKDEFNEFALARRSDGFKRFVSFLILISARSFAKDFSEILFIQDEPDLGLHPSGVKCLLSEMVALSRENYVLISSHSIFMVDKERVDRHLLVSKTEEVTKISAVDRSAVQDEEVLFNALGYSIFELIRPTNLIFEGWRDKKLFLTQIRRRGTSEKLLRSALKSDLGTTHAMGVKDVAKVVAYFDAIERKSIVISDGDDVAREAQRKFARERPNTKWIRYDELLKKDEALTAEDFVIASKLRGALTKLLQERGYAASLDATLFDEGTGCAVAQADDFLQNVVGITEKEERKQVIHAWKSEVFDDLQPENILDAYQHVVTGLLEVLELSEVDAELEQIIEDAKVH